MEDIKKNVILTFLGHVTLTFDIFKKLMAGEVIPKCLYVCIGTKFGQIVSAVQVLLGEHKKKDGKPFPIFLN